MAHNRIPPSANIPFNSPATSEIPSSQISPTTKPSKGAKKKEAVEPEHQNDAIRPVSGEGHSKDVSRSRAKVMRQIEGSSKATNAASAAQHALTAAVEKEYSSFMQEALADFLHRVKSEPGFFKIGKHVSSIGAHPTISAVMGALFGAIPGELLAYLETNRLHEQHFHGGPVDKPVFAKDASIVAFMAGGMAAALLGEFLYSINVVRKRRQPDVVDEEGRGSPAMAAGAQPPDSSNEGWGMAQGDIPLESQVGQAGPSGLERRLAPEIELEMLKWQRNKLNRLIHHDGQASGGIPEAAPQPAPDPGRDILFGAFAPSEDEPSSWRSGDTHPKQD